jgi:hypothetical protein
LPTIACIVEGQGDVQSIPLIVRRIADASEVYDVTIRPIRISRSKLVRPGELERAVELGAREAGAGGGVLLVVDADDDCPRNLGPTLQQRAQNARPDFATGIVLANKEKEAWYIAAIESLRGRRGLAADVTRPADPEGIRGAKEWIGARMGAGGYSEVSDQAAFAQLFEFEAARLYAPSFEKLEREVRRLLSGGPVQGA